MKETYPNIIANAVIIALVIIGFALVYSSGKEYPQHTELPCGVERVVMQEICRTSGKTWACNHAQVTYMACLRNEGYLLIKKEEENERLREYRGY